MVKVSVVVPVYNVEKYLRDCLDTLVNQSLHDIEIICVNDGSTDSSLDILNEYAGKDNRLKVISQDNGGHAVATNVGMSYATGKYLFLMDSDDVLELNALEDTYRAAEDKDVDFVLFKAINYDDEKGKYYEAENYSMNKITRIVGDDVFSYKDLGDSIFNITVTPWSKLYNREFIQKHDITFPEGLIFDDNVFFWKVLFNAKRIYFLKEFLFTRRWYSTSSTTKGDKRFIDSIDIYNLVWDVFREFNLFEEHKNTLYNQKVFLANMRFNKIKEEFKEDYFAAMKKDFMKILANKELYSDFIATITYHNKKIYEQVLICDSAKEFTLCRDTYSMVNSSSWKMINPLRKAKHVLKKIKNKIL